MRTALTRTAVLSAVSLIAVSVGLVASPATAAECDDPSQSCVVVRVVSTQDFKETETEYEFSAADIYAKADLTDPAFYTRSKAGADPEPKPRPGKALSLQALLTEVVARDADQTTLPDDVTFSEAADANGVPRVLDKPAFGDPKGTDYPYEDELPPSLYVMSDGRIAYFRPLTGEEDINSSDRFFIDGRFELTIHTTGKLLEPTVTVSNSAPTTKDSVAFDVTFADKPGTMRRYRWDFGDDRGPGRTDKSPEHRYKTKGTYGAFVTVRGANGSYGRSAVATVKVAKPPTPPKPVTTPKPGSGGGFGGTGGGGGGYVPPPYTPPDTSYPEPEPFDEPAEPEPEEPAPVDDGLKEVKGYVLAGSEIVPGGTPEMIPGTQASNAPTAASEVSTRKRIATWVVAALGMLALIGVGAASESRWVRTRLNVFRRRA